MTAIPPTFLGTPWPQIPGGHRILTGLAFDGQVFMDRGFADRESALGALAAQAADPEDPNPLPSLWLDRDAAEPALETMDYNPVSGLEIGRDSRPVSATPAQIIEMISEAA